MSTPKVQIPGQASSNGRNAADYRKYVIIDTNGLVFDAGSLFHGFDVIKDDNEQAIVSVYEQLFSAIGMEVKEREPRIKKAKKVDVSKLLAGNV